MKFLKFFLSAFLAFTSIVVFNAPSRAAELSVSGGQLSWDESTFFEPTGCSSFTFNYFNGTGIRLLQFKMEIKGRFGDKLTDRSVIGMPVGVTGAWSVQICKHQLTDGLGPYTVSLQVEDYNGSVRSTQGQLFFKSRTATATPTPTPTPAPTSPSTESVVTLDVIGGRLTWDGSTFFEPTGCSSFTFNYFNGTGIRLLQFKMEIKGRFGDKLTDRSVIGMPVGVTGAWSVQICKHQLTDGLGPYTVSLQVEDYNGSVRSTQGQLFFKSRTATATPTPTPTPTITPSAPAPSPRATSGAGDAANLTIPSLRLRLSAKSALVSWSSVFDAEGFEANYEVRITRRNSSTYGDWQETNFATSFQFSKLTPGAKYSVQVRAKTDNGAGKPKVISFRAR